MWVWSFSSYVVLLWAMCSGGQVPGGPGCCGSPTVALGSGSFARLLLGARGCQAEPEEAEKTLLMLRTEGKLPSLGVP